MSVTAARGFRAAGVACGIKGDGASDLALVATDDGAPVPAAAVFTSNLAAAAPVTVSRAHLASSRGRSSAVVLNSGNANAATGAAGKAHAERTCALVAEGLGTRAEHVLVCSTGLIGIPLPFDSLAQGIPPVVSALDGGPDGATAAAQAILTTDTVRKEVVIEGEGFVVGGMAKGAAMLAPNMATMLAVLTTDATAEPAVLKAALTAAVADSFNSLIIDGSTSTNDTVIVLASGRSERTTKPSRAHNDRVADALALACAGLAAQMAADAEGATKLARVVVRGARTRGDARKAAGKVAQSQLVQCSLYGGDSYWGRIVSELGSAGVAFDPDRVSVSYGGILVCAGGVAVDHDETAVTQHLVGRHVEIVADLGLGHDTATVLTTDLTPEYIAENMRTS